MVISIQLSYGCLYVLLLYLPSVLLLLSIGLLVMLMFHHVMLKHKHHPFMLIYLRNKTWHHIILKKGYSLIGKASCS